MNILHVSVSWATKLCTKTALLSLALFALVYTSQAACIIADSVDNTTANSYYGGLHNAPNHPNAGAFAALKSDGSITAWGDSDSGGSGAPTDSGYTQIYSTSRAFAALKSDGSITAWGSSGHGGSGAPVGDGYNIPYGMQCEFDYNSSPTDITLSLLTV